MPEAVKARVFMSGRSQHVTIPAEFRFNTREVYVRQDPQSGDLILSRTPESLDEIFTNLDRAGLGDNFMADRQQGVAEIREAW